MRVGFIEGQDAIRWECPTLVTCLCASGRKRHGPVFKVFGERVELNDLFYTICFVQKIVMVQNHLRSDINNPKTTILGTLLAPKGFSFTFNET